MIRSIAGIAKKAPAELRGAGFMSTAAMASAGMSGLVRDVSSGMHSFEIAFFRNLFGFMVLFPALWRQGQSALATKRLPMHALRGVLNAIAMLTYFYAVTITPLATVAALAFTSPLFATLLAIVILRERVGIRRWMGLLIGFGGALLIIRPGAGTIEFGAIMVLVSSMAWGGALVVIKILGRTETSLVTTSYGALFLLPITGATALFAWQWPTPEQWLLLAAIGGLGSITQICIAQAFREADATVVLPFDFTKLVWATLIGYAFFAEIPDGMTITGGAIICASVTYIAYREAQLSATSATSES